MKIGILCALEQEIRLLERDIAGETVRDRAGRRFYEGTLYGQEAVLARSRIGKVAAALTATILIESFGVDAILFGGTAGAIDPALQPGDIVVADRLVQHDFFTDEAHRFVVPLLDIAYFAADPALTGRLIQAARRYVGEELAADVPAAVRAECGVGRPRAVVGTVASGDQFISDPQKHAWLARHVENLQCVEMEGAAVAQVCCEFGVPCAVARVISDSADGNASVDFDRFVEEAASHFTRGVLRAFLR